MKKKGIVKEKASRHNRILTGGGTGEALKDIISIFLSVSTISLSLSVLT